MCIVAVNAGSSSLRISVFDAQNKLIFKGHADAIGQKNSQFRDKTNATEKILKKHFKNHSDALEFIIKQAPIENLKASVHRLVHGGTRFSAHTRIKGKDITELKKLSKWAPLHLPAQIEALSWMQKKFPKAPTHAFFDTAFHHTIPDLEKYYGIPLDLAKKKGWWRFGFHGISCEYLLKESQKILEKKSPNLIICHLGNGCSVTAVRKGISVATSMGATPLEGPLMGTRSGTLDPGLVLQMVESLGLEKTQKILQTESGFLGISGISSDIRALLKNKDERAQFTLELFCRQVAESIAQKRVALGTDPDALIFSGGIGENAAGLRQKILKQLPFPIGKTLVIATDEERFMAESIR